MSEITCGGTDKEGLDSNIMDLLDVSREIRDLLMQLEYEIKQANLERPKAKEICATACREIEKMSSRITEFHLELERELWRVLP